MKEGTEEKEEERREEEVGLEMEKGGQPPGTRKDRPEPSLNGDSI